MDSPVVQTLQTLRDIQGIQGSFVISALEGHLVARDLPTFVDDSALRQVGPRVCRMMDVFESTQPTEFASLRFADHRLEVRHVGSMMLCVLADANVNSPALRMAIKLVCRKLDGMTFATQGPPVTISPEPKENPAPVTYRMYRGTRIPVTAPSKSPT